MILFDIASGAWKLDEYKQDLWTATNIGIPHLDVEANDAVILGYQVAEFIGEVSVKKSTEYIYVFAAVLVLRIKF